MRNILDLGKTDGLEIGVVMVTRPISKFWGRRDIVETLVTFIDLKVSSAFYTCESFIY